MNAAEPPSLTLQITKGPREGDALTYHPTTDPIVRIGRLVRGNTLAIKDSGISSKHLTIHFHPDSCNWILNDLDSSNGTFVNGSAVGMEPGKGHVVGDGDRVKIGESTDFVCRVRGGGRDGTGLGLRRNPRRRGNLGEEKDGVRVRVRVLEEIVNGNGEGEEGGVLEEKRPAVRRRGPRKDGGVLKEVGVGCQREAKGKENSAVVRVADSKKVGRLKNEVNLMESEMKRLEDCPVIAVAERKRRRGGRKDEVSQGIVVKRPLEEPIEVKRVAQVVENVAAEALASTRRTSDRPMKEEQLLDKVLEIDGFACGDNKVLSTKTRTGLRGRSKNVHVAKESKSLDIIKELVDGAREDQENKDISNSIQGGIIERPSELPKGNQDSGNIDVGKQCIDHPPEIQKGNVDCDGTTDFRNENGYEVKAKVMRNELMPDLSKITVREWLDWLETNLPKEIIAETEKLIKEMRSRARQVKEYRAEQMMKREVK